MIQCNYLLFFILSFIINLLYATCTPHVATVGQSVWALADTILSVNGANKIIYQADIPFTVPGPGLYAIGETLTSINTSTLITNMYSNVTFDLKGHAIINQLGDTTTAIALHDNSNITICNGFINGFTYGITMANVSYTFINNMNINAAIVAANSSNIEVYDSLYFSSISASNSTNVTINDCIFGSTNLTNCSNCRIANAQSLGSVTLSAVTDSEFYNLYQDGGTAETFFTIINCSNNIFSNITRSLCAIAFDISGTSSSNTFDNILCSEIFNTPIIINPGVNKTRIVSSVFIRSALAGAAINNNGTNTHVYNNLIRRFATPVSDTVLGSGLVITGTNVTVNDANYWQNLFAQG